MVLRGGEPTFLYTTGLFQLASSCQKIVSRVPSVPSPPSPSPFTDLRDERVSSYPSRRAHQLAPRRSRLTPWDVCFPVIDPKPPITSGADGEFRWCLPLLILVDPSNGAQVEWILLNVQRCRPFPWYLSRFQQRGRNVHLLRSALTSNSSHWCPKIMHHALRTALRPRSHHALIHVSAGALLAY